MNYVFDASSLIYLGKVGLLEKITRLRGERYIPEGVYKEVVEKGRIRGDLEAATIDSLISLKKFIVKKIKTKYSIPLLSKADKEVIGLAHAKQAVAIIDEKLSRAVAESKGVIVHGILYITLLLIKERKITKKEAIQKIDEMLQLGFYLSAQKYKEILDVIKKM
jgi:predicted nucleic acid-binding protein